MKCLLVYNPISGKKKIGKNLEYIVKTLETKFEVADKYQTNFNGDAYEYISKNGQNYDYLIVGGGDGTLNEAVNAIIKNNLNLIIGYLPTGTTNDFGHTLNISTNIKKSVQTVLNGKVKQIDAMKINDMYGIYVCCSGIFTSASYLTKQKHKNRIGKLAYYFKGLKDCFCYKPFQINLTSKEKCYNSDVALILMINSKSVSGFKLNKNAQLDDGKIDIVIVESKNNKKIGLRAKFAIAKLFLFGIKNNSKHIKHFLTNKIDIEYLPNVVVNIDGENGLQENIKVEVAQKAISIIEG